MSMTRKKLVVRTGAAALWVGAGAAFVADRMGAFDEPPRFDRGEFPKPGRSSVAVLRAGSYDGDLEAVVLDGLRLVEADVRRKSVLLKPNLVEFVKGASINTDPRMVVAAANALRRLGASSVVVAEGPGHRRDTEAIAFASGLRDALDDAGLRFVDLNDAPLVRTPLETRYTGLRELWMPRILRETEVVVSMPKLKTHHWVGRHDVAEELLRLHARSRLRLAEGRLPRARHPGVDPRHLRGRPAVARDRGRDRRHAG